MSETFRQARKVKYLGMALSAFFLTAVLLSLGLLFLDEPREHGFHREHSVAIVVGMSVALYGSMLLGSLYIWRSYYVECFSIDGTSLRVRSMFQNHRFDVSELKRLHWNARPSGGRIRFETSSFHSSLDLGGYDVVDRLRIIRALVELAPEHVQENWPTFCHKIALPLRDGPRSRLRTDPSVRFVTITRRRYDRVAAIAIPASVVVAVAVGVIWSDWTFLAVPLMLIGAWLLLRSHVSPQWELQVHHASAMPGNAALVAIGAIVGSLVAMTGLRIYGVEKDIACWVGCAIMGPVLPYIMLMGHRADTRRRQADERAAPFAPDLWLDQNRRSCGRSARSIDLDV
jgi:hypothetical protein